MKTNAILLLLFFPFVSFAQESIDFLENKADSLYNAKKYKPALEIYNNLLTKKSNNSYYLSRKGLCFFKLENYQSAKEYLRLAALYEASENKVSLAYHYSNLSACYSNLYEFNKAYEYALKAYYLDETNQLTLWNAASNANNVKQYDKGISLLDRSKIEKHNDFNALYGRSYLGLGLYQKCIEYYEIFFQNLDNENRYAESINLLDEKQNLLKAYLGVLKSKIENNDTTYKYEKPLLSLTKELLIDKAIKKIILYIVEETKTKSNSFASILTKQFEMLTDRLPLENAIFYYRVKQYEKSQEWIEKIIKEKAYFTDEDENLVKMYRYLNELNLTLMNMDAQAEAIDDKKLESTVNYFRDYYADKKNKDYKEEILNYPLFENFITLNQTSAQNKNKVKYILNKIFQNIPNQTLKVEVLKLLNE